MARQTWPAFSNAPAKMPGATVLTSASSSTIEASLPPSSSEMRFRVSAAADITLVPVAVEPVNEILRTSGWWVSASPRSLLSAITLSTPFGSTSLTSSAKRSDDSGVVGATLTTSVLPAISAGGSLKASSSIG